MVYSTSVLNFTNNLNKKVMIEFKNKAVRPIRYKMVAVEVLKNNFIKDAKKGDKITISEHSAKTYAGEKYKAVKLAGSK